MPPNKPVTVVTQDELAALFQAGKHHEAKARWTEDVMIRAYLQDPDWEVLYREDSPLHHGFDFVAKHRPSGRVAVNEMKMSAKVGRLNTYLKNTKTKGKQMSLAWILKTAEEIRQSHPVAYDEIMNAVKKGLLRRMLVVANHRKRPDGWQSAGFGQMGMKAFQEGDFRNNPGFG